jgi:peptidyl-tRNA hydrolase
MFLSCTTGFLKKQPQRLISVGVNLAQPRCISFDIPNTQGTQQTGNKDHQRLFVSGTSYSFFESNTFHQLIGIGNWWFPKSRFSVGLNVMDRVVKHKGLEWVQRTDFKGWSAEGKDAIFFKPRTYEIKETGKTIFSFMDKMGVSAAEVTLFFPDEHELVGCWKLSKSGDPRKNKYLRSIYGIENGESFRRLGVGVRPPPTEVFQIPYLQQCFTSEAENDLNFFMAAFPWEHRKLIEQNVFSNTPKIVEAIWDTK